MKIDDDNDDIIYLNKNNSDNLNVFNETISRSLCRIYISKSNKGTGFFCKIPTITTNNNKFFYCLITNYHIINENSLSMVNQMNLCIRDKNYTLSLNKSRIIYSNSEYDIMILEILNEDNLDNTYFLNINDYINCSYINQEIYLLHNFNNSLSRGKILKASDIEFSHTCKGSSGSPIINISQNKVIGIHKGFSREKGNYGIMMKTIIKDLYNKEKILAHNYKNDKLINNIVKKNYYFFCKKCRRFPFLNLKKIKLILYAIIAMKALIKI